MAGRASIATLLLAVACSTAAYAAAEDITTRKLSIRDDADPARRQVQVQSTDPGIAYGDADSPATKGAAIHLYSDSDDYCLQLVAGARWTDNGSSWKYRDHDTRNLVQIGDRKIKVKIRSNVGFSLSDDEPHGTINAQIQLGDAGSRFCLRCDAPATDEALKYLAKDCAATACAAEPPGCDPVATTTTTTTTTTMPPLPGVELKAVLPQSNGRFTYAMTVGLAGSDTMCNSQFTGTHSCSYAELQTAETAGDLDHIKDINGNTVTSFWAIDGAQVGIRQCQTSIPWDYDTAHIGSFGDRVTLDNAAGTLGALEPSQLCQDTNWVGCCQ